MAKREGKAFMQILSIFLKDDHQFPIPEILAFFFVFATFIFGGLIGSIYAVQAALSFVSAASVAPLPVLMIIVWKNVAYGLGGDIERGTLQTFLSYPISRGRLMIAGLVSSVGVPFAVFVGAQLVSFYVLAPRLFLEQIAVVCLAYVAVLGNALLLTAVVLLATVLLKRAGLPLVVGILLYIGLAIAGSLILFYASSDGTIDLLLRGLSITEPIMALQAHYQGISTGMQKTWRIAFGDAMVLLGANYLLNVLLLAAAYFWFTRRLEA